MSVASVATGDPPRSVLARGLLVIETVARAERELRLSEIAGLTGLPQPTTHRILAELVDSGVLDRTDRRYRLGQRLLDFGAPAPPPVGLRDIALPVLEDLHAATGAIVQLAVIESGDSVVVEHISGHDVPSRSRVGDRSPAHQVAVGKAILAFSDEIEVCRAIIRSFEAGTGWPIVAPESLVADLKRVRMAGVASDSEASAAGFRDIAVPIMNADSRAIAAISTTAKAASRFDAVQLVPAVRLAAYSIGRAVQLLGV